MTQSVSRDPADEICRIMNQLYNNRLTTVSGGNLSLRDEEGNLWITPSGGDKGNYRREDILRIAPDGAVCGRAKPSIETELHQAIYEKRPDLRAVVHAHAPGLVALSLLHRTPEVRLLPTPAEKTGRLAFVPYECPGSSPLKEAVAAAFAAGADVAILANHGAFVGSAYSLADAYRVFESMELCAAIESRAAALGEPLRLLTDEQLADYRQPLFGAGATDSHIPPEAVALTESLRSFAARAYSRGLLSGTGSSLSGRLNQDAFLVTAGGADLQSLGPEDLLLVGGAGVSSSLTVAHAVATVAAATCRDAAAPAAATVAAATRRDAAAPTPTGYEALHQAIYRENPEVGAIIMAAPPNLMAFAVTGAAFPAAHAIAECCMVLRNVAKFPFGSTLTAPEQLARHFRETAPALLVENEGFLCVGRDLLTAFDRLEVAEFSARAWIEAKSSGGPLHPLGAEQTEEIARRFPLNKKSAGK